MRKPLLYLLAVMILSACGSSPLVLPKSANPTQEMATTAGASASTEATAQKITSEPVTPTATLTTTTPKTATEQRVIIAAAPFSPLSPPTLHPTPALSPTPTPTFEPLSDKPIDGYVFSPPELILETDRPIEIAQWLPDSNEELLIRSSTTDKFTIEILNMKTGDRNLLIETDNLVGDPVWLPTTQQVAYLSQDETEGRINLFLSKANAGVQSQGVGSQPLRNVSPPLVPAPDGASVLVFDAQMSRLQESGQAGQIQALTLVNPLPIVQGGPFARYQAAWSDETDWVAYYNRETFRLIDKQTGESKHIDLGQVDQGELWASCARWSADGKQLALIVSRGYDAPLIFTKLAILNPTTNQVRIIENDARYVTDIAWAPDNQHVLMEAQIASKEGRSIIALFLANSLTEQVIPVPAIPDETSQASFCDGLIWSSAGTITLEMHALTFPDGGWRDILCNSSPTARQSYGCTYFPDDAAYEYPFNSNTITIGIEGDTTSATDGSQQGYLHNVVAQEMTEGSTLAAYTAQTVASRTYAYNQTGGGAVTVDNSASNQVYLPYRYERLATETRRRTVHNAVTLPGRLYMTRPGSLQPINAHFGQDNCAFTEDRTDIAPYLKSIYDPISAKPDPCQNITHGTANGGMGSAGAARWGYGHTSEYNRADLGQPWSVRWEAGLLILVHYYTDIVIRTAAGQIVTPAARWNPLYVDWGGGSFTPPPMQTNGLVYVVIQAQNSGADAWTNDTVLSYQWQAAGGGPIDGATGVAVGSIIEGNYTGVTLPVRAPGDSDLYTLRTDMVHANGGYFHDREADKPWFTLEYPVCVGSSCRQVFLPLTLKQEGASNPDGCRWTIDNLLVDGGFNNLPAPAWREINVFIGPDDQDLDTLRTRTRSAPGDSPWSAVLGGVNDTDSNRDGQEDHDLFEHAVFQSNPLPNNVDKVAVEYSYYLTTQEPASTTIAWDNFFVDVQAGGLGLDNSLLGQPVRYSNLHPHKDVWRRRGLALEDGGDGLPIVDDMRDRAGKAIYLVFYSENDK